ncbi:MAG TPA: carboxypeptidase regulatory-like domain-containing protein [Terriglobales bacterium]|nr:carboxypeptidase regulatory-like domain-containing protein [Terriglobales bacterium]
MNRPFALAIFLLSALLLPGAQESAPPPKASSIAGTVVQEPGSQPLKKVLVQVIAEDQKQGGNYTASTDADGHFHIENVVPGRYRLFLERTGFVGVNGRGLQSETNVVAVQAGQSLEDLLLRMLPTAIISGRVTDEDGDPMPGVRVIAQKKKPGKTAREGAATVATNDLGEYRLSGLFPGQYWIVAMPPPDFRDYERRVPSPQGDNPSDARPDSRYLTTYYPATYDAMQASAVMLKANDEMPVNFTLLPARTYRVRGIVTGIPPGQKPVVELVAKAGDSIHADNDVGTDGQFELRGIGPGSYVLRATAGTDSQSLTARQDISVVAADVDAVKLVVQPSFTINGHLRIENGGGDLTQYAANLRQTELPEDPGFFMSPEFFGTNAPADRSGNFVWKNVNPGNYIVQVYGGDGQGFFLKSVTLGGRDIATGFMASGPATLELVVSTKGATIEGVVVEKEKDVDNEHAVPNATVVAVPEEKFRKLPDRFGNGSTDQHGRFIIRGVAPGSYTLYAWQDLEDGVWRDPDFLKSQEANGTAVKVAEDSHQQVELKLSPVDEEWR